MIKTNQLLLKYKNKIGDSQQDLAVIAGVPYHSVVKFFRDPGGIGANKAVKISTALLMPLDEAKDLWINTKLEHKTKLWLNEWEKQLALSKSEKSSVSYDSVMRALRPGTVVGAKTTIRLNPDNLDQAKKDWIKSMQDHKKNQWSKEWDREIK